ncbi:hypothetical protein KC939_02890, partial [Candidatus Saccharibacteria bacterium]|nr:hypothetical protein [Candidatus Saccharibacteria bacterium]
GVTGGDAYSIGGVEVFDVFDLSEYTFLEISRGGITGNTIEDTYTAYGVFKLRSGFIRGENSENVEQGATLHIRPTEAFVKAQTPNREHYTLTLNPTDFSDYSGGSS